MTTPPSVTRKNLLTALAANAERLLGVPTTGRNWRTVCAVMETAKSIIEE